jgi:hypothetical protein
MDKEAKTVGRAKTVLVSPSEGKAVITAVVATLRSGDSYDVSFGGEAAIQEATKQHIRRIVLPVLGRILSGLGVSLPALELTFLNLNATSAKDLPISISGHSADLSVLLAMISTALDIPIPQDVVATGALASVDGDVVLVSGLPEKLEATVAGGDIRLLLYPDLDSDASLKVLAPSERRAVEDALATTSYSIRTAPVPAVDELLRRVLAEDDIALSSLSHGYFETPSAVRDHRNPTERAVQYLATDNDKRFWTALQQAVFAGNTDRVRELVAAYVRFWTARGKYPSGFGLKLAQLMQSLPPAARASCVPPRLIPLKDYAPLIQYAGENDADDVAALSDILSRGSATPARDRPQEISEGIPERANSDVSGLARLVSMTNPDAVAAAIGNSINLARQTYVSDCLTVESHETFLAIVRAFYLHIQRHRGMVSLSVDAYSVAPDADSLLERAYSRTGGIKEAYAEARYGTHGGMRQVLDAMTRQYLAEEEQKYFDMVFHETVDLLDSSGKVALIGELMPQLAPFLPEDLQTAAPETFLNNIEPLVRAYVDSLSRIVNGLRRH